VPIVKTPKKIVMKSGLNPIVTGCRERRQIPMIKLKIPQIKFMIGEDSPTPLGLAKGVGNDLPCSPQVRCGTLLQRKAPVKKMAT
jgi:hypothetical protein